MAEDPVQLADFERARLFEVINAACDGAELAVAITLSDSDPPRSRRLLARASMSSCAI